MKPNLDPPSAPPEDSPSSSQDLTRLLGRWQDGDRSAQARVVELVYDELRNLARSYMKRERPGHTLQGTALVHEALLRLLGHQGGFTNREHFFRAAAQAMRRILVDHARRARAGTRISPEHRLPLDEATFESTVQLILPRVDTLDLDQALSRLTDLDPDLASVIELRCFVGLTIPEVAEIQGVSEATVSRGWKLAKAQLQKLLKNGGRKSTRE